MAFVRFDSFAIGDAVENEIGRPVPGCPRARVRSGLGTIGKVDGNPEQEVPGRGTGVGCCRSWFSGDHDSCHHRWADEKN